VAHTFEASGHWSVTLNVTDSLGYSQLSNQTIVVVSLGGSTNPAPNHPGTGGGNGTGSSDWPGPFYLELAAVAFVGLAIGGALGIASRRRRRPPATRSAP
jgi:hypothetical protein